MTFDQRVEDAIVMLKFGANVDTIRREHGSVILREAQETLPISRLRRAVAKAKAKLAEQAPVKSQTRVCQCDSCSQSLKPKTFVAKGIELRRMRYAPECKAAQTKRVTARRSSRNWYSKSPEERSAICAKWNAKYRRVA